jgi:hypothetical protein
MFVNVVLHDGPLYKRKVNVSASGTNDVLHRLQPGKRRRRNTCNRKSNNASQAPTNSAQSNLSEVYKRALNTVSDKTIKV